MYDKLALGMTMDSPLAWLLILKEKKLPENIKKAMKDYDEEMVRLVRNAIEEGLEEEKIRELVKPYFNYEQILQKLKGFKNGLSIEQVEIYADSCFEAQKMLYIRETIEAGVDLKLIKQFTNYKYDCMQMFEIMRALKLGIPVEKIKEFAHYGIPAKEMRREIESWEQENKLILKDEQKDFDKIKASIEKMLNE